MTRTATEEKLYRIAELYLDVPVHVVLRYLGTEKWEELVELYRTAFLIEDAPTEELREKIRANEYEESWEA